MNREPRAGLFPLHFPRLEWRDWHAWTGYIFVCLLPVAFAPALVKGLFAFSVRDDTFSHIPFVPVVTAALLFLGRERIFAGEKRWSALGAAAALVGFAAVVMAQVNPWQWALSNQISLLLLGFALVWTGAFGLFFGDHALRAAYFPLLFLGFAIPLPGPWLAGFVGFLRSGSADTVSAIFHLFHAPVVRHGFEFALPGVTIRVAEECSGIRSTLALAMAAALAGNLWLRSYWRTQLLCLATIPIAILKNALRIATLSWLAVSVDPRFLTGSIHHQYGGMIFFVFGLLMLWGAVALLRPDRFQTSSDS
jgi:exosortase